MYGLFNFTSSVTAVVQDRGFIGETGFGKSKCIKCKFDVVRNHKKKSNTRFRELIKAKKDLFNLFNCFKLKSTCHFKHRKYS